MSRLHLVTILVLLSLGILLLTGFGGDRVFWSQWGRNPQHEGMVSSFGQPLNHKLADIVYDPFVPQEKKENIPAYGEGALTAHYQSTLIDDDNSFYMVQKTGTYPLWCRISAVAADECSLPSLSNMRFSASPDQCCPGGGAGWNRLHGECGALRQHGHLSGGGES